MPHVKDKRVLKWCFNFFLGDSNESTNENDFILHGPVSDYVPAEHGLGCELYKCMQMNGDKIAQVSCVKSNLINK